VPDIEHIPAIADFYGVSIDSLFGRASENSTANIMKESDGLSIHEGTLKSFDLVFQVIRSCMSLFKAEKFDEIDDIIDNLNNNAIPDHIIERDDSYRTLLETKIACEMLINNSDTNMAVMLLGNESNFSWVDERVDGYIGLFQFLSDKNAIKLVKFVHDIYYSYGSGMILSILSLAYEYMAGVDNVYGGFSGVAKMIRTLSADRAEANFADGDNGGTK